MQLRWRGGLATVGITVVLLAHTQPGRAESSPDKVAAGQLVALVNQERAAAGVAPLGLSDVAIEVAEAWSVHMATTGVLAHNDAWFSTETKQRAGAAVAGENVAANIDVADAHRRLMASPQHRANILDPRFHQVGIGVVRGGDGRWWITEDFLQLRAVQNTNDVVEPVAPPAPGPPPPSPAPPASTPPAPPAPAPSSESVQPAPVEPASTVPPVGVPDSAGSDGGEVARGVAGADAAAGFGSSSGGIEVASGRGVVTPATRSDVVPSGLVALAVAGVLANATGLVHRRRRLLIEGKGGKITRS